MRKQEPAISPVSWRWKPSPSALSLPTERKMRGGKREDEVSAWVPKNEAERAKERDDEKVAIKKEIKGERESVTQCRAREGRRS